MFKMKSYEYELRHFSVINFIKMANFSLVHFAYIFGYDSFLFGYVRWFI